MNKPPAFIAWEKATHNLAVAFCEKYFGLEHDGQWVSDEPGGVLGVGDYFFNFDDIVEYLRHNYSKKKMFDYYWYNLECYEKEQKPMNIKTWKYLK
jgi:hypothetical protein